MRPSHQSRGIAAACFALLVYVFYHVNEHRQRFIFHFNLQVYFIMFYESLAKYYIAFIELKEDTRGVTAVEYAIVAVIMSGILLIAFNNGTLEDAIDGAMSTISSNISAAAASPDA